MDYTIQCKPPKKLRYTIGYLDENGNDEYHGYIVEGLFQAAREYGLNAIRFGHFASNVTYKHEFQISMVLEFIEQFELDGLIFLGWARAVSLNIESFRKRFGHIPLFSLGAGFEQIPHVYSPGDQYIREILLHLIRVHHYQKIAFIAPFWPDNRSDVYKSTMEEYGYYQPQLFISQSELANLEVPQRGKKAVSILLDERKVDVEAIVSLYNAETEGIILELQARGYNIPKDIAVTSYEDGALGEFNSPAFTTVYFPWKELGYCAGEKMAHLLTKGRIPLVTMVPGRIIIRNSCGCKSDSFYLADTSKIDPVNKRKIGLNGMDWQEINRQMTAVISGEHLDINNLLTALRSDIKERSVINFLKSLEAQIRLKFDYQTLSKMKDFLLVMRRITFPYIQNDEETLLLVEDLFQQAQVLLREKLFSFWGRKELNTKKINLALQKIGHALISSNYQESSLFDVLEISLQQLGIPSGYVFIFKNQNQDESIFNKCTLAFQYNDGQRISPIVKPISAKKLLLRTIFPQDQPSALMANMLHVADEFIGFVLFEPGPTDERVYQTLGLHISTALRGAILIDQLDNSYQKLVEQAHYQGKADTASGTLHNISNVLNSINTSIHLINELAKVSCITDFVNLSRLFKDNLFRIEDFISSDQGQKWLQFYLQLAEPLNEVRNQLSRHVDRMDERIRFIEDIITAYHNYTGTKSLIQEVELIGILEDALKIHQALFEKHQVVLVKNYQVSSKAVVQRTKLFHVLVNLIKNADEAMLEMPVDNRKLTLTVYQDNNGKYIRITDTGCGIPFEKLEDIFTYGFTTKAGGHGFGLNSSANYMKEMKAGIWAESDGPGKGATFVLKFN